MQYSPAEVIAEFLIAEGIFTRTSDDSDWPLYVSYMPDDDELPDDLAVIYDTEGVKDGRLMSGANVWHHGFQVQIRARSFQDGWMKATDAETSLASVARETVNMSSSSEYVLHNLSQTGPPMFFGLEGGTKRRNLIALNALATIEEV